MAPGPGMYRFRIDDIVLAASMEAAKLFECAICCHVAQEPVVQTSCGHIYCQECLAPCLLCPQCRHPVEASAVKLLRDVNQMGMRMMQAIKVLKRNLGRVRIWGGVASESRERLKMLHKV